MQGFWQLFSILISLFGFLIVGTVSLVRGDPFEISVIKAVIAFLVLYVIQHFLGVVLAYVASTGQNTPPIADSKPDRKYDTRIQD